MPFCEGENVIPLPAVEVPTRISPRELKVRITEGCTHQFTGNSLTLCFALSRRGHGMRCLRQRSYRCGCPDGNRHAHVVHCHARTSHNRRCPYRHPGKSLRVYCSCGSSIRLSVILKGRPVSSEPSQPQPRARKSLLSDDAFMLWRVPCATMSAHRPEDVCTRFRYPPGCRHHPGPCRHGSRHHP